MAIPIDAVFEHGVFRPQQPVRLEEGTRVQLVILPPAPAAGKTPAEVLAEIAALPVEGAGDPHTGRNHDRELYGAKDKP